uniref:INO80 complex subunit E n=1 Tax=Myripristis murdjan TaxID=586833 RepID=A0A667YYK8_9TELE
MLCPAAVNAAAVAGWLLAVLGLGLSLPAEDNSEPGFSLCSHCFYRQTPPRGASAGPLLRPLCHSLPGGQALATLYSPTCDTAVYSAFHLSHGWTQRGGEEGEDASELVSPADSPLHLWDSTVTTLVSSNIIPQCSAAGGDLYILTGTAGLGPAGDGEEECESKLLWSAVCCAVSEGEGGFSVGLIKETGEEEREVSVNELEEMLGATELFSGGCGAAGGKTEGGESREASVAAERVSSLDAQPEEAQVADVTQETSAQEVTSEYPQSSDGYETAAALESDTNSSSIVVYIISTTFSLLTAPLCPVVNTITQLPGQVTYVLQEDLGVLCALPGDTFSLLHLMTSDLVSWAGSAVDMLLGIGDTCFSGMYHCTSSMLGALMASCQTGVTGVGTLASDTVGIFGGAADNAWWVTKLFGGRLWEHSEGYVGTVVSEIGGQAQAVGGGLGKLVWRSGNGVGNVFRMGGGFVMGTIEMLIGAVREAFGHESD